MRTHINPTVHDPEQTEGVMGALHVSTVGFSFLFSPPIECWPPGLFLDLLDLLDLLIHDLADPPHPSSVFQLPLGC